MLLSPFVNFWINQIWETLQRCSSKQPFLTVANFEATIFGYKQPLMHHAWRILFTEDAGVFVNIVFWKSRKTLRASPLVEFILIENSSMGVFR